MEYYNPHILRLEDFSDTGPVEQREQSSRATPRPPGTNGDEDGVSSNDDAELETILDSLSHRLVAQEISPIPNIKSKLHPHQKEAVDFVFRREMGQLSSDLSLWKYDDTDPNEPFYRHVLSGSKRPEPAEITGGIIADDMGLGKSLVMISTIVSSIDRAKEFVASQSSRKIACPATLIIVPSSLLIDNWVDEIRKHTNPGSLAFYKYLGPDRHKEEQHLREALVVFTTYATAAAEFQRSDGHNLASFNWFRVVIDEAHYIRNRSTRQFQAIASIPALYRWCLTGTPIQNSLEDLGSLVTFLKVPILEKSPAFSRFIMKPIQSGSRSGFQNLRTLLQTICIRRTNRILKDLPKPVREKRMVAFTPVEWSQYRDLIAEGAKRIDMAISRRGRKTPSSVKLESLLRLRLFCNNGAYSAGLELAPEGLPVDPDEALAYLQQQSQDMCVYCSSMIYSISNKIKNTDGAILIPSCGHLVCHRCLAQHRHDKLCCPTCANGNALPLPVPPAAISDMSTDVENPNSARNSQRVGDFPSKLLALLDDIRPNKTHKSIVFSSWKKTLHLVGRMLTRHGIPYNIIEGSMPLSERLKVLKDYQSIMGTNILLMTLGTGAVGLNLAITSRIYLLEPQWNPTIEDQAIGRALRLDQTNQVTIIRYIMRDSIEEMSVLFRQERKIKLASDGLGNRNRDISPQRSQAVQDVFSKVFLK
ncbi:SNF2 family N-terminal domain-containing protein [Xylaria arbuscula]|nr:SNF2 family N-terminal domain-containing protein [Xylaria arbuscula]